MKRWTYTGRDPEEPSFHYHRCGELHAIVAQQQDASGSRRYTLTVRHAERIPTLTELWRARKRLIPAGVEMVEVHLPPGEETPPLARFMLERGLQPWTQDFPGELA